MAPTPANHDKHEQQIVREYGSYGAIIGGALGLIVGVVVTGPRFSQQPASITVSMLFACTVGGALVGYIAARIARYFAKGPYGPPLLDNETENDLSDHAPTEGDSADTSASNGD
ncbi:MAG: hypothetical protein ACM31P_05015 [Actinomycetota bacterium]